MIVAMSSTAIVLSSLSEKALLRTPGGQASFSVLLFQDIAVIPILAIFPLLAAKPVATDEPTRPGWLSAVLILGAVALVVGAGRYLVRPVFRWLAETRLREIFTAAALLLVIAITLLMQAVGLSPALGTFLAGVVLAESEYRHELESDIEPFKGLLLGVFFISVGAQIDFEYIGQHPGLVVGLVAASMALKLGVLYAVSRLFGLDRTARWLFAFALAQIGEFAFVLVSFGTQARVFGADIATPLVAVVALSMALTPLAFLMLERQILPRLTSTEVPEQDTIEHEENPWWSPATGASVRSSGAFCARTACQSPSSISIRRWWTCSASSASSATTATPRAPSSSTPPAASGRSSSSSPSTTRIRRP